MMELKNIASAFVKSKKEFAPAIKNALNPHFRSKYADLAACIDAVNDAFLNNGIAMYQETFEDNSGVTIETVLLHESGESLRCGKLHVPAPKADPQGYGSALSYCRRYSLLAACGIAAEDDDDGNAASGPVKPPMHVSRPPVQPTSSVPQASTTPPAVTPKPVAIPEPKPGCISVPQIRRLFAIAKAAGKTEPQMKAYLTSIGLASANDMPRGIYEAAVKWAEMKDEAVIDEGPIDEPPF